MSEELIIEVRRREDLGKNSNRRLRGEGRVPAVVYGGGIDSVTVSLSDRQLQAHLRKAGENAVFLLQLDGSEESRHAMIKEMQQDPRNGDTIHVDFQRILMTEKVKVSVQIELVGTPEGVRVDGGMVDFVTREVEIECLPGAIPEVLRHDIEAMEVGQHVEAGELALPEGVELTDDPHKVILSVAAARLAAEETEEGEDAEVEVEAPAE